MNSSLTQGRKAKLSAFTPRQTNAFYSVVYGSFSFNLKKRSCCSYELFYIVKSVNLRQRRMIVSGIPCLIMFSLL